jgi:hypothetical protein
MDVNLLTGAVTHSLQKLMMVVRPQTKVLLIFFQAQLTSLSLTVLQSSGSGGLFLM